MQLNSPEHGGMMRRAALLMVMLTLCAQPASAQRARAAVSYISAPMPAIQRASAATQQSSSASFAYEALGGIAGSLAGFGLGYALFSDDCEGDDITCELESAGMTIVISAAAATAGSHLAGRAFDTNPSLAGAALGSVIGAVAGVGAWHLVTEDLDIVSGVVPAALTYSIVHGVLTALGSRIA